MTETELLELMADLGALHRGHFLLSSGLHSDTYFQCALVLQFPDLALELGRLIAQRHAEMEIDLVASPALGGLLIGHEVARGLGRRFIFTERQGTEMTLRRGFRIEQGEKVLIVEDVVTRGTSSCEVARVVEAAGGVVRGVAALVDRTGATADLPAPLQALARVDVAAWPPAACPLCAAGSAAVKPGSRGGGSAP
jgi:orotate phosphoribosyltransferase